MKIVMKLLLILFNNYFNWENINLVFKKFIASGLLKFYFLNYGYLLLLISLENHVYFIRPISMIYLDSCSLTYLKN